MKVYNYIIITTAMMFLLALAGFNIPGVSELLSILGIGSDHMEITWANVFNYLFSPTGILTSIAVAGGAIVASLFAKTQGENLIILPFITGHLVLFIGALVSIMNYSFANYPGVISIIIAAILGPLTIGYIIALIEFFRGTD